MIDLEQRVGVLEEKSQQTEKVLTRLVTVMENTLNLLKDTYTQVVSNQKSIAENQKSIAELNDKSDRLMDITHNNYESIEAVKAIAEGNAAGIARLNERQGES